MITPLLRDMLCLQDSGTQGLGSRTLRKAISLYAGYESERDMSKSGKKENKKNKSNDDSRRKTRRRNNNERALRRRTQTGEAKSLNKEAGEIESEEEVGKEEFERENP